jgi:predicted SprT family Zn-dependent metalloprotease
MIEKIKRHLLNAVLLLVLFSSCKKEVSLEIQQENQANFNELKSLVSQVKLWHDSTVSINLSTKIQNGVRAFSVNENDIVPPLVDWDKAFINFDSSSVKSITVPISMNYKTGERMQLVATKSKNKLNGYFIKVTPDSNYYSKQKNIQDFTDFNGTICIYNLIGVRIKRQDFKDGIVLNSNNGSKSNLTYNTTFGEGEVGYDAILIDVVVSASVRKRKNLAGYERDYQLSYVRIFYQQNLHLDELGDGGGVIAGGDESPEEPPKIENKIEDSCLSIIVNKIINDNLSNKLSKDILEIYGTSEKMNLYFNERNNNEGNSPGNHKVSYFANGTANYNIYIDLTKMRSASQEYIASVVIHEIAHAIIKSNIKNSGNVQSHYLMLQYYINDMKLFLQDTYNVNNDEALSLIFEGIGNLDNNINDEKVPDEWFLAFKKIVEDYKFSCVYGDSNYYTLQSALFKTGEKGIKLCQ